MKWSLTCRVKIYRCMYAVSVSTRRLKIFMKCLANVKFLKTNSSTSLFYEFEFYRKKDSVMRRMYFVDWSHKSVVNNSIVMHGLERLESSWCTIQGSFYWVMSDRSTTIQPQLNSDFLSWPRPLTRSRIAAKLTVL